MAVNLGIAALATAIPLVVLEATLRWFVDLGPEVRGVRPTRLFERDAELGWKLRPGAEDVWGGVRVRINDKGLRGPELDYPKSPGVIRILYLGDSVPFGFKIARPGSTFPYGVEAILEHQLGRAIETVNTGVGGYSPWQEFRVLAGEGILYDPDLVVVSFVLNDVTEKFDLIRFGGTSEGHQLVRSVRSRLDRALSHTAIGTVGRRWVARLRFGDDVQSGAEALSALRAQQLALEPERPEVGRAWRVTLESLDQIVSFCRERELPVWIAVFPYAFQLSDAERLSAPQRALRRFAAERDVPFVDLLPAFAQAVERGEPIAEYFADEMHPSARGHALAADVIAARLHASGLFSRRTKTE